MIEIERPAHISAQKKVGLPNLGSPTSNNKASKLLSRNNYSFSGMSSNSDDVGSVID